jgi:hypothetical protein
MRRVCGGTTCEKWCQVRMWMQRMSTGTPGERSQRGRLRVCAGKLRHRGLCDMTAASVYSHTMSKRGARTRRRRRRL